MQPVALAPSRTPTGHRSGTRAWICSRRLKAVKRPPGGSKYLTLSPFLLRYPLVIPCGGISAARWTMSPSGVSVSAVVPSRCGLGSYLPGSRPDAPPAPAPSPAAPLPFFVVTAAPAGPPTAPPMTFPLIAAIFFPVAAPAAPPIANLAALSPANAFGATSKPHTPTTAKVFAFSSPPPKAPVVLRVGRAGPQRSLHRQIRERIRAQPEPNATPEFPDSNLPVSNSRTRSRWRFQVIVQSAPSWQR